MANEYIAPIFAILGAIIGGSISYISASKIKSMEIKQTNINSEIEIRREIYSKFLAEANNLALTSTVKKSNDALFLSNIFRLLAEIQLISNGNVYDNANKIISYILDMNTTIKKHDVEFPNLRSEFIKSANEEFSIIKGEI
ncbi:hypothetical protein L9G15_11930 [Shewanella sp. A3A]|nr:hypothetical protein [Shewanella ferrihydritica]